MMVCTNPEVLCSRDTDTWQSSCVEILYTFAHVRSALQKGKALFLTHYGLLQHKDGAVHVPALVALQVWEPQLMKLL